MKDPNRCPACGIGGSVRLDQRRCAECGARLLKPTDDFVQLKRDWVLSYYVYFPLNSSGFFKGWVYSSHLEKPDPNKSGQKIQAPPSEYGMHKRHPLAQDPIPLSQIPR